MMISDKQHEAYYLLGFSAATTATQPLPAILQQLRIESRVASGVVAWYRAIPRQEFEGPEAQRNLADLHWLTPRVLAHETVVSKLSELFAFYPARFGCLFSSVDVLMHYAVSHRITLRDFFAEAQHRREWGIKFTTDLDQATLRAGREQLAIGEDHVSGANYLKLKQLQRTLRLPVLRDLHSQCDQRIERLRDTFCHVVIRPCRSLAQPDRETLLANVALWLTDTEAEVASQICDEWNQDSTQPHSVLVTHTGPWPAYSFCPSLGAATSERAAA